MSIADLALFSPRKLPFEPSSECRWPLTSATAIFLWTRTFNMQHIRHATGNCSVTNSASARAHLSQSHHSAIWPGQRYTCITRDRRWSVRTLCHGTCTCFDCSSLHFPHIPCQTLFRFHCLPAHLHHSRLCFLSMAFGSCRGSTPTPLPV